MVRGLGQSRGGRNSLFGLRVSSTRITLTGGVTVEPVRPKRSEKVFTDRPLESMTEEPSDSTLFVLYWTLPGM